MAVTTVSSANRVDQWSEDYMVEYVRDNEFSPYMGKTENAIIQIVEDLVKKPGDDITVSLIGRLTGNGVTGDNTLEGNEEAMNDYGHKITVDQLRNAVAVGHMEQQKTHIELLEAAKTVLKNWSMDKMRDDIIAALMSPNVDGSTAYASTAEGDKDTWVTAQYAADRVLFGAAISNYSAADHSASLLNVDSTSDILQPAIVSLAKRIAKRVKSSARNIRPSKVNSNGEWFVLFAPSVAFRDFKAHATTVGILEYAADRGKNNPLFTDGDLLYDGVVIHEVPSIPTIAGVGNGAIAVAPCFLCGAQSVGVAWAERTKAIFDTRDFGNISGRGVAETRGIDKLTFDSVQNGVLSLYVSGVADT